MLSKLSSESLFSFNKTLDYIIRGADEVIRLVAVDRLVIKLLGSVALIDIDFDAVLFFEVRDNIEVDILAVDEHIYAAGLGAARERAHGAEAEHNCHNCRRNSYKNRFFHFSSPINSFFPLPRFSPY